MSDDHEYNLRTNPRTGAVERVPRTETTAVQKPSLPSPNAFQPAPSITVTEVDGDVRSQSIVMSTTPSHRQQAERAFAKVQDEGLRSGLINERGEVLNIPGREREAQLLRLRLKSAREAVAYSATVVPHLDAERQALLGMAREDIANRDFQRNQLALRNHDAARAAEKGQSFVTERPIHERAMLINGEWVEVA